jgi:hypothetical protein
VNFFGDRLASRVLDDVERVRQLAEALRGADSFLVVAPIIEYTARETELVRRFVDKGGKVLLLGDPTRIKRLNSLATALGINYEDDYLYNVVEHETNFRNIIVRDFASHPLTEGLSAIVLYTANSITGAAQPVAWGDANTRSSAREAPGVLTPLAVAMGGRVVAVGDATFIQPPYNETLDNDKFITNLAEFLTTSQRRFDLEDFPFLLSDEADVVMAGSDVLGPATQLAQLLSSEDRRAVLASLERPTVDTVFVGLYRDRDRVNHHLRAAEITFAEGKIRTPFAPPIPEAGSGLLLLDTRADRHVLVVMASSGQELAGLVRLIKGGPFRQGLVAPTLGLYDLR